MAPPPVLQPPSRCCGPAAAAVPPVLQAVLEDADRKELRSAEIGQEGGRGGGGRGGGGGGTRRLGAIASAALVREIAGDRARRERRALCRHRRIDCRPACDEGPAEKCQAGTLRRTGQQEGGTGRAGRARRHPEVVARDRWQRLTHDVIAMSLSEEVEPIALTARSRRKLHRDKGLLAVLPKVTRGKIRDGGRRARARSTLAEGVRRQRVPWPQRKEGVQRSAARVVERVGLQGRLGVGWATAAAVTMAPRRMVDGASSSWAQYRRRVR